MFYYVLCLLILLPAANVTSNEYCDICKTHTLCQFPGKSETCSFYSGPLISENDKLVILKMHNDIRRKISRGYKENGVTLPSAADMEKVEWDDELQIMSQRFVDQCEFRHDECRKLSRFYVGQNLYMESYIKPILKAPWDEVLDTWIKEVDEFDQKNINPFKYNQTTGHFTQIIWAKTKKIGCAVSYFTEQGRYNILMNCYYGPAGNIEGRGAAIYTVGKSCNSCPNTCLQNLCVSNNTNII